MMKYNALLLDIEIDYIHI